MKVGGSILLNRVSKMNDHEFNEFWDWLLNKSDYDPCVASCIKSRKEEWDWLLNKSDYDPCVASCLKSRKEEWDRMPVCECGHRLRKTVEVLSKAFYCGSGRRIAFERTTRCANCLKIVETEDYRKPVIRAIRDGSIRVNDLEILKEELGVTDG